MFITALVAIIWYGDRFNLAIPAATSWGTCKKAILVDKKAAANRIDAIIHEVLTAPIKLSKKTLNDSCRVKTVKTRVAKTPTAAASDGVAIPEYIDPKTINIKIVIGTKLNNPKTMSFTEGFFSIVGAKEGLIRHLTIM